MNLGILIYENTWLPGKSSNIGDYVQTLAQINLYKKIVAEYYKEDISFEVFFESVLSGGYRDFKFLFIPRDNLSQTASKYPNEKIYVVMNGWYMHGCNEERELDWPPPANIIPCFISFHVADQRLFHGKYLDYWRKHQPIGCRDMATMKKFKQVGIDAYFTGCLTLTIDFFEWNSTVNRTAVIDVNVNPKNVSYKFDMFKHMEYKHWNYLDALRESYHLLEKYSRYERVVTSRLHAYLPCISMGVPTKFVSPEGSSAKKTWGPPNRFGGIRGLDRAGILRIRENIYDRIDEFMSFITNEGRE